MKRLLRYFIQCFSVFASLHANAQAWVTVGTPGFSVGTAFSTSIAIDTGGTPYVAYSDEGIGLKASLMKYNGSSWVNVGIAGFSASIANYTSIAIDNNGTPYVVYEDGVYFSDTSKATVMKYNGSSWVNVGSSRFSTGPVDFTSIAIDSDRTPYVVYQDGGDSGKATVMKYNGSSWVTVGSAGFSDSLATYTSIAIDHSGILYVVYQDGGDSGKATVMKYNTGSWVTVGSAGFSAGEADFTSIAIDGSGMPYVVYQDYGNGSKATVMKFNGSSWVTVGSAGFSIGPAFYTSLAIDNSGTPYVTYLDWDYDSKATVMKYDGSSWVIVANRGFSTGHVQNNSIAIDNSGTPYVAYMDINNKATVVKFDTSLSLIAGLDTLCVGSTTTLSDPKSGGIWSSSNTAIAIIDATGFVTSLAIGNTTISYTKSGYSTTLNMLVDSLPVAGTLLPNVDSICPGDSLIIHNTATGGMWISMDTNIAIFKSDMYITSSSYGLLVGVASGLATLAYINSNNCGSDTITYAFWVGCPAGVKNITHAAASSINAFPNPTSTSLTISSTNKISQITITNLLGQTLFTHDYNTDQVQIDVADLPPGIYFVKINGSEVRKFVKE